MKPVMKPMSHALACLLAALLALGPAAAAPPTPADPAPADPATAEPAAPAAPVAAPAPAADPPPVQALTRVPPAERAAMQLAYDDGYDRGLGVPLMVWGSVYLLVGGALVLLADAADSEGSSGLTDYFTILGGVVAGIGAAQLIPGALLFSGSDVDRNAPDAVRLAHAAGYDHGVGNALIGYGIAFALPLLSLAAGDSPGGVSNIVGTLVASGLHLALGVSYRISGISEMEALLAQDAREQARTAWRPRGVDTQVLPVFAVDF